MHHYTSQPKIGVYQPFHAKEAVSVLTTACAHLTAPHPSPPRRIKNPALIRLRRPVMRIPELVRDLPSCTHINLALHQASLRHRYDYALTAGETRRGQPTGLQFTVTRSAPGFKTPHGFKQNWNDNKPKLTTLADPPFCLAHRGKLK